MCDYGVQTNRQTDKSHSEVHNAEKDMRLSRPIIVVVEILDHHEIGSDYFLRWSSETLCLFFFDLITHFSTEWSSILHSPTITIAECVVLRLQRHSNLYLTNDSALNCRPQTLHGCKRTRRVGNSTESMVRQCSKDQLRGSPGISSSIVSINCTHRRECFLHCHAYEACSSKKKKWSTAIDGEREKSFSYGNNNIKMAEQIEIHVNFSAVREKENKMVTIKRCVPEQAERLLKEFHCIEQTNNI